MSANKRLPSAIRLTALATLAALTGCVIAPLGGPYRTMPAPYEPGPPGPPGSLVEMAPPSQQYEVIPVAPAVGYVWIGGFWNWQLGHHVWVGGRWAQPPHGHHWVPHRWERTPQGWRQHPGYWGRR